MCCDLQVASYDFILPVAINDTEAPTPASTPYPSTPGSRKSTALSHANLSRVIPHEVVTPRRRVVATALRQPLKLSTTVIQFEPTFEEAEDEEIPFSNLTIENSAISKAVKWRAEIVSKSADNQIAFSLENFGLSAEATLEVGEKSVLKVFFAADKSGDHEAELMIFVNEDETPYRSVSLSGTRKAPTLEFSPPTGIILMPVPLGVEITADFSVTAQSYAQLVFLISSGGSFLFPAPSNF